MIVTNEDEQLIKIMERIEAKATIVYDCKGIELFRFNTTREMFCPFHEISPLIIKAFLAIEDRSFFSHNGISFKGIVRSIYTNIVHQRLAQGASTITQQLVRLTILNHEKTLQRKLKELYYTILIEWYYTKEQILESYLNQAYFGAGVYGIAHACKLFWNINPSDVTIAQAATLAGIIQSPGRLCPLKHPEHTIKRRNQVLAAMHACQVISDIDYDRAIEEELTLIPPQTYDPWGHIKVLIRKLLKQQGHPSLHTEGLTIYTTIDKDMQAKACAIFRSGIQNLQKEINPLLDGGLICLDNGTGGIKAIVGGYNFNTSQFNRATQAKRQIGSTIKPFIYGLALQEGIPLTTIFYDEPTTYHAGNHIWTPHNYDKKFRGEMTLAYALAHSNNIVTIKLLEKIGPNKLTTLLAKTSLNLETPPHLSLALGCIDTSLINIAQLFTIFAKTGKPVTPYLIESIENHKKELIFHVKQTPEHTLFDPSICAQVRSVLMHALENVYKQKLSVPAFGKTGTTNDSRSCFFVGSTPSFTTALYCGCDDNRPIGNNIFPSKTVLPLWTAFNKSIEQPATQFSQPPNLQVKLIDIKTGTPIKNLSEQNKASTLRLLTPLNL